MLRGLGLEAPRDLVFEFDLATKPHLASTRGYEETHGTTLSAWEAEKDQFRVTSVEFVVQLVHDALQPLHLKVHPRKLGCTFLRGLWHNSAE